MIRKPKSGEYRLYSRKVNPKTGRRRNRNSGRRSQKAPLLSTARRGSCFSLFVTSAGLLRRTQAR
jgi:hypothetical protein